MTGYNKIIEVLNPKEIICYGEPFDNMKGYVKGISHYTKINNFTGFSQLRRCSFTKKD